MRNTSQSGGYTSHSEAESVDTVHTSFLLDRTPKNEDPMLLCVLIAWAGKSALPSLQIACWLAPLSPSEASGQDDAPTSRA
ncbi:hypothetical protein J3A64_001774 [Pseudarthrobacter sp. PvP004]|nr:hypothetical protein [Pseudarthrobacter sp. PvP004]